MKNCQIDQILLDLLSHPIIYPHNLLLDSSVVICHIYYSLDELFEDYIADEFLLNFTKIVCLYTSPDILDNLSHALGLLLGFDPQKFQRMQKLGIFKKYFHNLYRSLSTELHSLAPRGVYYFFQNYYFSSYEFDDLFFDVSFPYTLEIIENLDRSTYPDEYANVLSFVNHLMCLAKTSDKREYHQTEIFVNFLQKIRETTFNFE